MIPPSIPMVVYGVAAGASIGSLFMGGIIPGILVGIALMIVSAYYAKKRNYPRDERVSFKEAVWIIIKGIPAMLTVIIILGGIVGGFFTPTEAAGIAALYSFIIGRVLYKELFFRDIPQILSEVARTTGQVALMIATASSLAWLFAQQGVPAMIGGWLTGITTNRFLILLLVTFCCSLWVPGLSLSPAVTSSPQPAADRHPTRNFSGAFRRYHGCQPGHRLFTPPVGVCLFVSCGIAKCSIASVVKAFIPFFLAMLVVLMLITYCEPLVMFLPNLFVS